MTQKGMRAVGFDINNCASVVMNQLGADLCNQSNKEFHEAFGGSSLERVVVNQGDEKRFQMWHLMSKFGHTCYLGGEPAFNTKIKVDVSLNAIEDALSVDDLVTMLANKFEREESAVAALENMLSNQLLTKTKEQEENTVSVEFSPEMIELIDTAMKRGGFASRSETVAALMQQPLVVVENFKKAVAKERGVA